MKKWGALVLLIVLLTGCSRPEPVYQEQSYVFGTLVEVTVYGEEATQARAAVAAVMQEFQRLHALLHAWQPSALSELNHAVARGEAATVPVELAEMLKDAAQLSAQSGELFNPAIGGLIKTWGFQSDEFKAQLPDGARLNAWVSARPRLSDLVFSAGADEIRVRSRNRAVQLDLGGYAKGYALDRAAQLLKQRGVRNALINIGGNVLALGKHGERDWRVGIQHPRQPGALATLTLQDGEAVGTSGDYQRFFELNGKRYCHLIDPRTGHPVQGVQAVTVLVRGERAGRLSDVASKPLFVSGAEGWRAAAQKMQIEAALLVDAQGVVHLTGTMEKRLEFADKSSVRRAEPPP